VNTRIALGALVLLVPAAALGEEPVVLDPVVVTAKAVKGDALGSPPGEARLDADELSRRRAGTADATQLIEGVPGVDISAAGGISSLPAIHGLADDRLRIQVDGVDLQSACPNHMNSPLSYATPSKITRVRVYDGVAPVSVGGDSLGGTVQVESPPPEFAHDGVPYLLHASAGSFFRSNGLGLGYNLSASAAVNWLRLDYAESGSRSDNYRAGRAFKAAAAGREGGGIVPASEVGSSAYHGSVNRAFGLAVRHGPHLLRAEASRQTVDFEGFPNQRMDMTSNDNRMLNLRYTGQFDWGDLEARVGYQQTQHRMDMGPDRYSYGTGMPMDTKARQRQASLRASLPVGNEALLRLGTEGQYYTLFDWWPPVGGVMGPNAFWNVDFGRRSKVDGFAEWEQHFGETWTALFGVRGTRVATNAAAVQGYDNGLSAAWGNDAAAFNGREREKDDALLDATGWLEYVRGPRSAFQAGLAQKSRAPNLYQRYPWSTNPMAALMNNFLGDGNGYVGNVDLRPEIARTLSLAGDLHDAERSRWSLRVNGYYTSVHDYIDAYRCDTGQCPAGTSAGQFVLLRYANVSARLFGADVSVHRTISFGERRGEIELNATASYLRGQNTSTGDNLYAIMPPHGRLSVLYRLRGFTVAPEWVAVAAKHHVSRVRNEIETGAYWLVNLRASFAWKSLRADAAVENIFDRLYADPMGGAYVGQGASMTTNGVPWGVGVPGRGRSVNVSVVWQY
jgi:iron complex outermembrane receptor protein